MLKHMSAFVEYVYTPATFQCVCLDTAAISSIILHVEFKLQLVFQTMIFFTSGPLGTVKMAKFHNFAGPDL